MKNELRIIILRSFLTLALMGFVFLLIYGFLLWRNFDQRIWKMPLSVNHSEKEFATTCDDITSCDLLPGDILVRRYSTPRTFLAEHLFDFYYTHSAFYIGDGQIVEAYGKSRDSSEEIQVVSIAASDWVSEDISEILILRPHYRKGVYHSIEQKLITIAGDTQYRFGIPRNATDKRTTCAALIVDVLEEASVIAALPEEVVVTPDYLVWMASTNENFELKRVVNNVSLRRKN